MLKLGDRDLKSYLSDLRSLIRQVVNIINNTKLCWVMQNFGSKELKVPHEELFGGRDAKRKVVFSCASVVSSLDTFSKIRLVPNRDKRSIHVWYKPDFRENV